MSAVGWTRALASPVAVTEDDTDQIVGAGVALVLFLVVTTVLVVLLFVVQQRQRRAARSDEGIPGDATATDDAGASHVARAQAVEARLREIAVRDAAGSGPSAPPHDDPSGRPPDASDAPGDDEAHPR